APPSLGVMISSWSRDTPLDSSPLLMLRMTIARSGLPVPFSAILKPLAIDRIATSTPTTPAIPTTITADENTRDGTFLRFIHVISRIWPSMAPSTTRLRRCLAPRLMLAQRVDDTQPSCGERRHGTDDRAEQHGKQRTDRERNWRGGERRQNIRNR